MAKTKKLQIFQMHFSLFQERNDSIGGPLDSMRYSLEPHLLDIMRNNANQEKGLLNLI